VLRPLVRARLQEALAHRPGRVQFLRVLLEERGGERRARSAGNQDTGILRTMLRADGIAVIPAEQGDVAAGGEVDVQVTRGGLELREP
jgi:molybdopterin molybdotransferase